MQPLYKQEAAEIDLGWIQNSNCCNVYCMVFFPSLFSQLFFFCKCNHGLNAHTAHVEISKLREFSVSFLLFHPKSMKSFKTFVFFAINQMSLQFFFLLSCLRHTKNRIYAWLYCFQTELALTQIVNKHSHTNAYIKLCVWAAKNPSSEKSRSRAFHHYNTKYFK